MDERRINVRVDDGLFRKLKEKLAQEDTSFQEVLTTLLEAWLSGGIGGTKTGTIDADKPGKRPSVNTGEHNVRLDLEGAALQALREIHEQLDRVLAGGVAAEAVMHNLSAFDKFTELSYGSAGPDPEQAAINYQKTVDRIRAHEKEHRRLGDDAKPSETRVRRSKARNPSKAS